MIENLVIHKIATYADKVDITPTEINYLFGSNGTGKTALSKLISDPTTYVNCNVSWKNTPLETLVYNRDFVSTHFAQSDSIKGIFTLGKDSKEAQDFISETKKKIDDLTTKIDGLTNSLSAQQKQKAHNKNDVADKCWTLKRKYEQQFRQAYSGYMGSAATFFEKCVQERDNSSTLLSWDDINAKCKRVFSSSLKSYEMLDEFEYTGLADTEATDILSTKIIGKEDVKIGELIKKLNNSDWIKDGVGYLSETEDTCPFCQQHIESALKDEIEGFFDETYANQCKEIADFKRAYSAYMNQKIEALERISASEIGIIDLEDLRAQTGLIKEIYKKNLLLLATKEKSPSTIIEIESLDTALEKAKAIVAGHRNEIKKNNDTFANIGGEKAILKGEVWRFVANELNTDLTNFEKTLSGIEKACKSIKDALKESTDEKIRLAKEVKTKEAEVTSIVHTVNEINKILSLFGFTNFQLAESTETGFYQIVREDGSVVEETLSEGEYTFITFLYFYQLLKGSIEDSGMSRDKVVVFDDPISSLDSNILFVVSNLIKEVVRDCRTQSNGVKQVFILTHNVYFHKEVTFRGGREKGKWKEESFWVVRKLNNKSNIILYDDNPIQTTYELLWREARNIEEINKATIYNSLRRILEYYFNIIGGLDYEQCINNFDGEEKIICKSLISWINDGSHFINDDLIVYTEPENVERYLNVFKSIFDKMGHISHYKMMMKTDKEPEPKTELA